MLFIYIFSILTHMNINLCCVGHIITPKILVSSWVPRCTVGNEQGFVRQTRFWHFYPLVNFCWWNPKNLTVNFLKYFYAVTIQSTFLTWKMYFFETKYSIRKKKYSCHIKVWICIVGELSMNTWVKRISKAFLIWNNLRLNPGLCGKEPAYVLPTAVVESLIKWHGVWLVHLVYVCFSICCYLHHLMQSDTKLQFVGQSCLCSSSPFCSFKWQISFLRYLKKGWFLSVGFRSSSSICNFCFKG